MFKETLPQQKIIDHTEDPTPASKRIYKSDDGFTLSFFHSGRIHLYSRQNHSWKFTRIRKIHFQVDLSL